MSEYYKILRVSENASRKDIRAAYRKLAKTCHPDLHPNNPALKQTFIQLTEAYNTLSDTNSRVRYDNENGVTEDKFTNYPKQPYQGDSYEEFLAQYQSREKKSHRREEFLDIESWILAILSSPITYCILFFFLMVFGLKELMISFTAHPHFTYR